jgi:5-hydroxyisourate hydrolase
VPRDLQRDSFYPFVEVVFYVGNVTQHYHVPLLLNPFGYTTYRGS